jgi:GntR family transcriptional regulator, transcriptional repressor for pyruvate dehydrogenase complex
MEAGRRPRKTSFRQPRIAELIAESLRVRIMSGELRDDDFLPKQGALLDEFRVSKPSLREALRILETEGLITVQRGNVGGARVHSPRAQDAGYMIGLVLQAKNVALEDVGAALRRVEPLCTGLCAARVDRATSVIPSLREIHKASVASIADDIKFTALSHLFHHTLVSCCGNETLKVVVGALESLWSERQEEWARQVTGTSGFPGPRIRRSGIKAHERIIQLVEDGETENVMQFARSHLETVEMYTGQATAGPTHVSGLRRWHAGDGQASTPWGRGA